MELGQIHTGRPLFKGVLARIIDGKNLNTFVV
jgi:hypothetical protein